LLLMNTSAVARNYGLRVSTKGWAVHCANDFVLIADALTPSVAHSADRSKETTMVFALSEMRGAFSDSDVKFEYYDDGRLKGFNGASTGQGEAALKTALAVIGGLVALDGGSRSYPTECAAIKKIGGDKPLLLTYTLDLVLEKTVPDSTGQSEKKILNTDYQTFRPEAVTSVIVEEHALAPAIGRVCAKISEVSQPSPRVDYQANEDDILLPVREPGLVKVKVTTGNDSKCGINEIWEGDLAIAQFGTPYELPIPPATMFGKRAMAVAFAESGAIASVQFTSNSGAGQALNVANSLLTASNGETAAEKAAALKAEADLIAQQQRLLACLAEPKNCK